MACQTGDDCFNHPLGLMRIPDRDRQRTSLFGRIIVAAWKYRIPNEDHLIDRDVKDVPQFSNAIGLVDAMPGHIDRAG